MDLAEALRRRRMVRAYDPTRPVPADALDAVCAAAFRAPSAGFTQAVSLLVLTEPGERDRFWSTTGTGESRWLRGMRTAPTLVLLWTSRAAYLDRYAEPDKGWTDRDPDRWPAPYWFVDGGMAGLAMLLTAVDQGLGACFFGLPTGQIGAVRETFRVPETQLNVGVISLGFEAAGGPVGSPARRPRRDPEELIHRGQWG